MHDEKRWFYQKVIAEQQGSELAAVLEEHPDCEFYELCQKFVDVGLNSDKLKGDVDKITACFRYEDMDAARKATADFVHKYNLNNLNGRRFERYSSERHYNYGRLICIWEILFFFNTSR